MRRVRTIPVIVGATVLATATTLALPASARAAVACGEAALITAIDTANAAGGGNVVLAAGCTYTLTTPHSSDGNGPNGLPIITTAITLTGDNNIITRSTQPGTPAFRIAKVAGGGDLTIKGNVTLSNGRAATNGGGILNLGAVTLTASALTGNTALGDGGGLANEGVAAPAKGATTTLTDSTVSGNTATGRGGGIHNGSRGTLTTTSSFVNGGNTAARGGGIAAVDATATTLTGTPVSANKALLTAGGIYRRNGTMTLTTSPVGGNAPNNCVGSSPAVPGCVG
ncbi:right-handed parallel beta-helix repeat-containing protein [Streptomyces buecherae]|uniref:right-handed parallel beta-helix repeat-containing protein n=1 Tax=Streptomyces buecherae TaxID=2763006 RepID=UPI00340F882F